MFPASYATFEVIILIRIFYFLCFNVISAISITFVLDETKERNRLAIIMKRNQDKLTALSGKILDTYKDEKVPLDTEMKKKDFFDYRDKTLKEAAQEIEKIKTGKSEE